MTDDELLDLLIERELEGRAKEAQQAKPNTNPGVSPDAPPEMLLNPKTGQYTSREMLKANMSPTPAQAVARGVQQGVSFGFGDEAQGAINAVLPTGGSMAERYTFGREYDRAANEAAQSAHPWAYTGGEVGGGATATLSYGIPAMAGRGLGGAMLAGGGVGAAEGVAYGAGTGEGARDRIARALGFGALGLGVGAAMPPATSAIRAGARAAGDVVGGGLDYFLGQGRQGRADRALAKTLRGSGRSADDIVDALMGASRDGQPEFRAMDALGIAGQRRASGIARAGGDASEEIAQFLRQRQLDQPERMAGFVANAFDGQQTAQATQSGLKEARDAAANTAYAQARGNAAPVDVRPALAVIDDRIGGMAGSNVAGDGIDGRLAGFRARLAADPAPEGEIARELSDFDRVLGVKQDVQDAIGAAVRAGRNNEARELGKLQKALDEALEASSDGYRQANDGFAASSRVIEAVDRGADMAAPRTRADDNIAAFNAMTPEQQAAARVGYGDRALGRIEVSPGEATNRARPFTSTKARVEAAAIARDPDMFARQVDREMTMHETMTKALGGSRTADNLQDIEDLSGFDVGMLGNLLQGRFAAAGQQAMAQAGSALTGASPETRRIIAQALMARDASAFRRAIDQAQTSDSRKAVVDALLRIAAQKTEYGGSVN